MIVVVLALLVALSLSVMPVWRHSSNWSWWPSLVLLGFLLIIGVLLAIERLEAA